MERFASDPRRATRELAQQLDVLAGGEGALLAQPVGRDLVELYVLGRNPQADARQPSQLAQLGAGERRLRGAAPAEHDHLPDRAPAQRLEARGPPRPCARAPRAEREHPGHVRGDVAVADHDRALGGQVEVQVAVVGMAVVPGDELGSGPAAGRILARDPERLVGLGTGRVDDAE
jgi:hypothetical protein